MKGKAVCARRSMLAPLGPCVFMLLLFTLVPGPGVGSARGQESEAPNGGEPISKAKAAALTKYLEGEWVGARLLCRKEENDAVRCGKPVRFAVTFHDDGTGSSADEHFPKSFRYRWKSTSEVVLTPVPDGKELTLFQFEIQEGFLSFQTYIYLAVTDPSLPKEANYIHYIFDVHRVE